jgi:hypothetical protein
MSTYVASAASKGDSACYVAFIGTRLAVLVGYSGCFGGVCWRCMPALQIARTVLVVALWYGMVVPLDFALWYSPFQKCMQTSIPFAASSMLLVKSHTTVLYFLKRLKLE